MATETADLNQTLGAVVGASAAVGESLADRLRGDQPIVMGNFDLRVIQTNGMQIVSVAGHPSRPQVG